MKYNSKNQPTKCILTQSRCYLNTSKMKPLGVLWHSTGANNPNLARYVQPSSNDTDKAKLEALLGVNKYNNHWNKPTGSAGLNAFIGKLKDGTVTTIQTMPWDYRPWGCGSGSKGSCNSGWVQFEICEDSLTDKAYFEKVYKEACELTAYICTLYNLNPKGSVTFKGVKVPVILCHADSHKLGLGSNHGDVLHWFKKYGKTMDDVRNDVAALMGAQEEVKPQEEVEPKAKVVEVTLTQLARGSKGAEVKTVQRLVSAFGFSVGKSGIDGDFGAATEKAVKAFQTKQGLKADGIVGAATWGALLK